MHQLAPQGRHSHKHVPSTADMIPSFARNVHKHHAMLTKSPRCQLNRAFVIQAPPWAQTNSFHSPSDQSTKQAIPRRRPQLCQIPIFIGQGAEQQPEEKAKSFVPRTTLVETRNFGLGFASVLSPGLGSERVRPRVQFENDPAEVPTATAVPTVNFSATRFYSPTR